MPLVVVRTLLVSLALTEEVFPVHVSEHEALVRQVSLLLFLCSSIAVVCVL